MSELRLRKFSPIDRDYPIYEVVDGDCVLLDVGRTDDGAYEVAFHAGASGRVMSLAVLERMIAEARELLAAEVPT